MAGPHSVEYIYVSRISSENPDMKVNIEPSWYVRACSYLQTFIVPAQLVALLLLAATCSPAQDATPVATLSITGIVKSGNTPIPGATVTAVNSSTQEKTQTSSDINGAYSLQVTVPGKYQLRVDMPAFTSLTKDNRSHRRWFSRRPGINAALADSTSCPHTGSTANCPGRRRPRISKHVRDAGTGRSGIR